MRKYHRYNKEEMFLAIEMWQESGLSKCQFCANENIAKSTFGYWLKKYKMGKGLVKASRKSKDKSFIPVRVNPSLSTVDTFDAPIEIYFPNGVRLMCSSSIDMNRLKTLISI